MNERVVVLAGPTAVGKTKLSIYLAKRFRGEVINGDAMQVYRGLDIGTAKIKADETEGIPHHLIDICDPGEEYTVADFQKDAREKISEITSRGNLPILAGGTGFYVKAALFDYRFSSPGVNQALRRKMDQIVREEGPAALYKKLKAVDPATASRIHPNNVVRVMRALEVYESTGVPLSRQQQQVSDQPLYDSVLIGLTMERSLLYQRINQRVDQMVREGLVDEARSLDKRGFRGSQAAQAIGYKEFFPYFDGTITLDEAVRQLKQNTRHYAKRQYTWFLRQMEMNWFDMSDALSNFSQIAGKIAAFIEKQ
ncbi:tRNA (adenosine(37)-N6)-dimethylallyltransferase MiaA [Sporolactobacillus sp. THM7-4]|nr:tRNA (adenosine(37)-N6)-dimethylallyltransferase MiaA [Sporolactobacillus sp. THM7-4]